MDDERDLELIDGSDPPPDAPDAPQAGLEELLAAAAAANADLLERLRLALLASDPSIDPALVTGSTPEEVETSFAAAQRMVAGIREAVRREHAAPIPAGAPGRVTAGPATPYDKIRSGLSRLGAS